VRTFAALGPAVLSASIALAGETGPGSWPSFRGERGSGLAAGPAPPIQWDGVKPVNVRWKAAVPGLAHSSPIVWGDRVFLTTAVPREGEPYLRTGLYGDVDSVEGEPPQAWRVLALDRRTGAVLWERTAHEGPPKARRHMKATHANSTPATDGKRLVALFGSEGLYCYDLHGKLLWKRDLGVLDAGWFFNSAYAWGFGSSPIIHGDLVIVQADVDGGSFLAALSLNDGREVWRTSREEIPSWGTPTIVPAGDGVELVTNGSRYLRGYHPATGAELWKVANKSEITVATPVYADGLVFISNGYRPVPSLHAIRPGGRGDLSLKEGEARNDRVAWYLDRGGTYLPTPIVVGEHLYTLANQGVLTCYRAATGEKMYQERLGGKGGSFSASPVAAGDRIYLPSEEGDVFVVKAGAKYELLATNPMGEVMIATPAIADGTLFVRTRGHLVAIAEAAAAEPAEGKAGAR